MARFPEIFERNIVGVFGAEGRAWLDRLPETLATAADRWSLTVLPPFDMLSFNYVAPAIRADGTGVVVKLGVPTREVRTEIDALSVYRGRGCIRLLAADREQGLLLLERVQPGTPLSQITDDAEATMIAARAMRELWQPPPALHEFPSVADWASGLDDLRATFGGTTGPFSRRLVEQAESLFRDLIATMAAPVVLHGDLHHDNILAAERQPWLVIDPKGVIGEPAYEVGALLRNPAPQIFTTPDLAGVMTQRADILAAELGLDRDRILAWSMAQAVLSAWWSYDGQVYDWQPMLVLAETLATLLP